GKGDAPDASSLYLPFLDGGPGAHVDAPGSVDRGIHLAHLVAQGASERHRRGLHHQHLLAQVPGGRTNLGADEAGPDQEKSRAPAKCIAEGLAVAQGSQSHHIGRGRSIWKTARSATRGDYQNVKAHVASALQRKRAIGERAPDDSLLEPKLDLFLRVLVLGVEEHLLQLDLAAQELLG